MQLGFVIDHSRCIGCHACTVACKSENDVPLGSFRTWVKYTERGEFPQVRRSFAVLRCNQCTLAPCVEICPVVALHKRPDGIVDIDPGRCIGCKGCMQACPYDALYLNEDTGFAEKCHFCAHRVEQGLAPACAVICPTEAIVPGDFDDPQSRVSTMAAEGTLHLRKAEAGTRPNVLYKEVDPAGIDPLQTNAAGGFIWANQFPGVQLDTQLFEAMERKAEARTVYDVHHPPKWGRRVSGYLFTKSLAAGAWIAGALAIPALFAGTDAAAGIAPAALSLLFLLVTTVLLVLDLKHPERFLYILRYPNWSSWLARGAVVLSAYGGLATLALGLGVFSITPGRAAGAALTLLTAVAAALTAVYTAWLFRQARGRVLWMRRSLEAELLVHAVVAGAALLLLLRPLLGDGVSAVTLRTTLVAGLIVQGLLMLAEGLFAPRGREAEYGRAIRLLTRGPFAARRWGLVVGLGIVAPLLVLVIGGAGWSEPLAAVLALAGLFVEQDCMVMAGQATAIS